MDYKDQNNCAESARQIYLICRPIYVPVEGWIWYDKGVSDGYRCDVLGGYLMIYSRLLMFAIRVFIMTTSLQSPPPVRMRDSLCVPFYKANST